MPVELPATSRATSSPTTYGHIGIGATNGPGADFAALPLPDGIVAVARASERVSYLMKDRAQNLFMTVAFYEVGGKLDPAMVIYAEAHRLLAAVESE